MPRVMVTPSVHHGVKTAKFGGFKSVILAGTLPEERLQHALSAHPLEIELHDRDPQLVDEGGLGKISEMRASWEARVEGGESVWDVDTAAFSEYRAALLEAGDHAGYGLANL